MRSLKCEVISGLVCMLALFSFAQAKEITFDATVDRNSVAMGEVLQLNLTFNHTQEIPTLDLPAIDSFQSRYNGPSTMMTIVNGKATSSITHIYTLFPLKVGKFSLGPFRFELNNDTYISNKIEIEVMGSNQPLPSQVSSTVKNSSQDIASRLFVTIQVRKRKVYLNEIIPLSIKIYINRIGIRDIQLPSFGHDGFSASSFDQPKQYQEVLSGVNYDVLEFATTIFGIKPGEFKLGPATVQCNLLAKRNTGRPPSRLDDFFGPDAFDGFFGNYEVHPMTIKSPEVPIAVLSLPEEGKPEGFSGALGQFDMDVSAGPAEVKVGDPVTLKITIRGNGNLGTVSMPKIASEKGFKVYEPQVKQNQNEKSFEQILIPLDTNVTEVPLLAFSFFDVNNEKYQTISRGPFAIRVVKPEKEEEQKIVESKGLVQLPKEEQLGRDIIFIKDSLGKVKKKGDYLYKNPVILWMQIIPFLIYVFVFWLHKRQSRLRQDVKYARRLLAPRKARKGLRNVRRLLDSAPTGRFYDTVFNTLQEYLGDRFHLTSRGITIGVIDEHLKGKAVPPEILTAIKDIFSACDIARYASSQLAKDDLKNSLKNLETVIDYFQRNKV